MCAYVCVFLSICIFKVILKKVIDEEDFWIAVNTQYMHTFVHYTPVLSAFEVPCLVVQYKHSHQYTGHPSIRFLQLKEHRLDGTWCYMCLQGPASPQTASRTVRTLNVVTTSPVTDPSCVCLKPRLPLTCCSENSLQQPQPHSSRRWSSWLKMTRFSTLQRRRRLTRGKLRCWTTGSFYVSRIHWTHALPQSKSCTCSLSMTVVQYLVSCISRSKCCWLSWIFNVIPKVCNDQFAQQLSLILVHLTFLDFLFKFNVMIK